MISWVDHAGDSLRIMIICVNNRAIRKISVQTTGAAPEGQFLYAGDQFPV